MDAVTRVVEAVFTEPEKKEDEKNAPTLSNLTKLEGDSNWEPFWEPQAVEAT